MYIIVILTPFIHACICRSQQLIRTNTLKVETSTTNSKSTSVFEQQQAQKEPSSLSPPHHVESIPSSVPDAAAAEVVDTSVTLPGAADHPILQLSDAKFRGTPVSEMFKWYGEASGGGSCAKDFGNTLIGMSLF